MGQSRRKTPVCSVTCARSDKPYKVAEHRRERAMERVALRTGEEMVGRKAFGDPWKSNKDGKMWFGGDASEARLLRK